MSSIGDWSEADLRRFIVNTVLSDPANQKKKELPDGPAPGNILTELVTGALAWKGGLVKLDEQFGTSSGSWLFFDPIPQHFRHLLIVHAICMSDAAQGVGMYTRFNGDGGGNYFFTTSIGAGGAATFQTQGYVGNVPAMTNPRMGAGFLLIPNYCGPLGVGDSRSWFAGTFDWGTAGGGNTTICGGMWLQTAAIKAVTLMNLAGGGAKLGSVATLYGLG